MKEWSLINFNLLYTAIFFKYIHQDKIDKDRTYFIRKKLITNKFE